MRGKLTNLVKVCYGFGVIGVKMVGLMGQGWVMKSRREKRCSTTLSLCRIKNKSKRQADVSSACLPLSYEVLLIDKNEFVVRGECRP